MAITEQQRHLTKREMINFGSYYTKSHLVDIVYNIIYANIPVNTLEQHTILDSSCGYGSFFNNQKIKNNKKIGADIDKQAILKVRQNIPGLNTINHNSLMMFDRSD